MDRLVDGVIVVAVGVATAVPFVDPAPGAVTWLGAALNLATVVPLLWRRRWPFAVMIVVGAAATLVSLYDQPGQRLQYAGLVAIYTLAGLGRRWQRIGLLAVILGTFPPASLLLKHNDLDEFMFTFLLPVAAWLLGSLERSHRAHAATLRERAQHLERERIAEAARAAAEERARVARDMHDILAHAVSLMVVQAEAGPVVVRTDPDRAARAFEAIADAGRDAMVQLRRLLGVLKAGEDRAPQPTLAGLADLVRDKAVLEETGGRRVVPPDTEVAVYRIVQEALTNTVKHANASRVEVRLAWLPSVLEVTVVDDGRGASSGGDDRGQAGRLHRGSAAPGAMDRGGHGLIGIRERAAACGGTAQAGPLPGGGFQVQVRIPCP